MIAEPEGCDTSDPPKSPLTDPEATDLALVLKAIADPARLRLLSTIRANGETCACDLAECVDLGQSTVSHHLSVPTKAGWVIREKRGIWAWFHANPY
jgi:ArsR family transcriptional regulator